MKKNVASQIVGAQLNSRTDGSPVTSGTTTVYVTGDGGTQAAGSVGSGACTHEGHGFWTYTPAQAETNFDHVAFTFENSSGVNATVQVWPSFPQTGDGFARLGAPAGASAAADIAAIKAILPAALVGGRMDSSVGAMANNVLTAAAINADAITDAKVASDVTIASVTGSVGSVTGLTASDVGAIKGKTDNLPSDPADESLIIAATDAIMGRLGAPAGASVSADVAAVKGDSGAIKTKTDQLAFGTSNRVNAQVYGIEDDAITDASIAPGTTFELEAGAAPEIAAAVWDEPIADHADTGSTGDALSNAGAAGAPPTASEVADAVWDQALAGHLGAGSTGNALNAAGSAGDPWATTLPGSYGAGSAGKLLSDNLNATISSRAAAATLGAPAGASIAADIAAVQADTDNLQSRVPAALVGGRMDASVGAVASGAIDAGAIAADAIGSSELAASAAAEIATAVRTELATELARMDAAVTTRLAAGSYTAPDNASIAAIKAKTDNLPSDPADESLIIAATDAIMTRLGAPAGASLSADIALKTGYRLSAAGVADIVRTAMTESYAADGAAPTLEQILFMVWSMLSNKDITVDTLTTRKLDGTTVAMTFALDSGATPTSQARAT